jgi:hypothetical protein
MWALPEMMLGTAMFTIVVSTRIMTMPAETTASTSQGLRPCTDRSTGFEAASRSGLARSGAASVSMAGSLAMTDGHANAGHDAASKGDLDE